MRNDCEQMSGKCICKPGIKGDKCDICPDETQISPSGCEGRKFDDGNFSSTFEILNRYKCNVSNIIAKIFEPQ